VAEALPIEVHLPAAWRTLFGELSGRARFVRRFNRPTNLGEQERVCIALADVGGPVTLRVNGEPVDSTAVTDPSVRTFDITRRLESHNELEIEVEVDPSQHAEVPGGLWQPVTIEIHG
jgi:hypothetical protein